jgi:nucleotidyltransferase substrate binding protein (TIGR01987 family)
MDKDIRWKQRFKNYLQAFRELESAVVLSKERALSKLEKQGLIQAFEYTHELSWNLLKDYLAEYGHTGLIGSKDTTRLAFKTGLISDGEIWMEMIKARNLTSHSYDEALAEEVHVWIIGKFFPVFALLAEKFSALVDLEHE